jgi:hypothetical protein
MTDQPSAVTVRSQLRTVLASKYVVPLTTATIVIVAGLLGWRWWAGRQLPAPYNAAKVVGEAAFEERWGIRVTLIGVTADGGLVDFRYIVIDSDKALAMLDDFENRPVLVDESTNAILLPSTPPSTHRDPPLPGQTFILLYSNPNGVVQTGSRVSVIIGDMRLEHFVAK